MTTLLQLGTEWDVQTVLVIFGIVVIFFGIAGYLIVPKVGFQPLDPLRGAALVVFGVALLAVGLGIELFGEDGEPRTGLLAPTTPRQETPTSAAPTPTRTSTPVPTPLAPTPTPCVLLSTRPHIAGPPSGLEVTIDDPRHCEEDLASRQPVPVRGTYSGDLAGKEVWLLVYPPDGEYYPQSPDDCRQLPARASGGQWATNAYLGPSGVPQQFDLVATVTDVGSEASREFKMWLQSGCDTGDFPGFIELPGGLTEMDVVTVHTRG